MFGGLSQRHNFEVNGDEEGIPLTATEALIEESNMRVRHGFIQKVYGILCVELLVTFIGAGITSSLGSEWFHKHQAAATGIIVLASFGSMMMMFVFACCSQTMRQSPTNYVLLLLFTM